MINVGVILRALGWQAVGAGMAAKSGYDSIKAHQSERQKRNHYAPVTEWWARYGVSYDECSHFLNSYMRSVGYVDGPEVKDRVLNRLRDKVHTDDRYVKYLLQTGGTDLVGQERVCVMYYASKGRAARYRSVIGNFPMAGVYDCKPAVKQVVLQLLKDNGVPDTHWYLDSIAEQERRLSSM